MAKIVTDNDPRVPSLRNLMTKLKNDQLRDQLRQLFAAWDLPINEDDPVVLEALKRMELREEQAKRKQFGALYDELKERWELLSERPELDAFRTLRDKVSAHSELRFHLDTYKRVELGELGLEWGHLKRLVMEVQELVERVGVLIRNASFAWDMLDKQLSSASKSFWQTGWRMQRKDPGPAAVGRLVPGAMAASDSRPVHLEPIRAACAEVP